MCCPQCSQDAMENLSVLILNPIQAFLVPGDKAKDVRRWSN